MTLIYNYITSIFNAKAMLLFFCSVIPLIILWPLQILFINAMLGPNPQAGTTHTLSF